VMKKNGRSYLEHGGRLNITIYVYLLNIYFALALFVHNASSDVSAPLKTVHQIHYCISCVLILLSTEDRMNSFQNT
jgi:hypothetical protein